MTLPGRMICMAVLVSAMAVAQANAQVPQVPNPAGTPQLTQEQLRDVLLLRALQSRSNRGGSRGVQRGVPQFVPYGSPWFMGTANSAQQPDSKDSKSSQDRAARIERLRQAREEAVAKRQAAVKERAKARAEARAKAAASGQANN